MNESHADSSAPGPAAPEPRSGAWSRQRWLTLVALVFAAEVLIIFALGQKHFPQPRAVKTVPQLAVAGSSGNLIELDDPTLFALPRVGDFASAFTNPLPAVPQPPFGWTESPLPPPLVADNLGAVFTRFMQTNRFAAPLLDFKPEPELSEPALSLPAEFAENSVMRIEGELSQRKWLNPVDLASWPYAAVIAPSRVQVLVDAAGDVGSAILIPPDDVAEAASHYDAADQRAFELARAVRFSPSSRPTVGQLVFDWRTVAPPATNPPAAAP